MATSDYLDPEGYWVDPDRNIHRSGNEDGEQEIIASATKVCSKAEWHLLCEALAMVTKVSRWDTSEPS